MNHNGNYSGKILDEKGKGLPFANVYLTNSVNGDKPENGTLFGVSSDLVGEFNFTQLNQSDEEFKYIVSSYLGYKRNVKELSKVNEQNIIFNMVPSSTQLDEFVVEAKDPEKRKIKLIIAGSSVILIGLIIYLIKKIK